MPRISQFYGIAIYMYYQDHAPSHFHAIYGEHEAVIDIVTAEVREGKLPHRARALVREWAATHQAELQVNWDLARAGQPLNAVNPLD